MASDALHRIKYPPLSAYAVVSFIIATLCELPFVAPLSSIFEAAMILSLFYPIVMVWEIWRERTRSYQPVQWTFTQQATLKITQLAFGFFDYTLGRAVFSESASLGLMSKRMGNSKVLHQICHKTEAVLGDGKKVAGWWIGHPGTGKAIADGLPQSTKSPVLIYYIGGGFVMARPAFYLEFLHKLRTTLGHSHPSLENILIFAPEYPLVPEQTHPAQPEAARLAYEYVANRPGIDTSRIMVAGDSAGAHLALGLRIGIANAEEAAFSAYQGLPMPAQMVLISPFIELDVPTTPPKGSSLERNAPFDFVDPYSLAFFAQLFSGSARPADRPSGFKAYLRRKTIFSLLFENPHATASATTVKTQTKSEIEHLKLCEAEALLSPGTHAARLLRDKKPVPTLVTYGKGEVLADQSARLVKALGKDATEITAPHVHAWPIVLLNLGRDEEERKSGIVAIASWLTKESCND